MTLLGAALVFVPLGAFVQLSHAYFSDLHNPQSDLYRLTAGNDIFSRATSDIASIFFRSLFSLTPWTMLPTLIRRCHDRDRSAWFLLPMAALSFIPYLCYAAWPALLIDLGALKGTPGPNFYGPAPSLS